MFDRMMKNQERHAKLMGEMMRRFGVLEAGDISMTGAVALESATRACMGCRSLAECEHWMEETSGTEGAGEFCPNVQRFTELTS